MFKRNLWKIVLSLAIVVWAITELIPTTDIPFVDYAREHATAKEPEFAKLLEEAKSLEVSRQATSAFVGLKKLARERQIDLIQYFPSIDLADVKNVDRRNNLLLDELLRRSRSKLQTGLDLKGGVSVILEVDPKAIAADNQYEREQKLSKAVEVISNRVNQFGVAEPVIRPIGENRIEVQVALDTKSNPDVVEAIKKPAILEFRLVHPSIPPMMQPPTEAIPNYEVLPVEEEDKRTGELYTMYYLVNRLPEMTGEHVESALPMQDPIAGIQVHLNFDSEGAKQFGAVTSANVGRLLGIVLDGKLYSAPRINDAITGGSAQISGRFDAREAERLAGALNNPLALPLTVIAQNEVGPTLAADSIISAKNAFVISTSLTVIFMLVFYTIGGLVAAIGMGVNVLVTLGVLANIPGATLTLPGIAGIVLTLAMSVDSNILIFERMREELKLGKSLPNALESGFDKAWSAILDSNVTTLLVAAIMIALGNGPVKGFGVTLAIGIFTTMFAAIVISKLLLEALIHGEVIKRLPMFSMLQATKLDFLRFAKPAFIVSWLVVLVGVGVVISKGKTIYGIDFLGGDQVTFNFAQKVDTGALRTASEKAGFEEAVFAYEQPIGGAREVLKVTAPFEQGTKLATQLQQAFPEAKFEFSAETRIGPAVGKEIQVNAAWSVFWALVLIFLYVAFRFEMGYGVGAVVSTVHDLLITVGFFVLFDRQFNAPMVAAILLIIGYSINDTVVVFDRIREELKLNPTGSLRDVINRSLNLTLSRTIITGGTSLLTAITLIAVTTGDVNDIAFTLLIGVLTGTFSSLFIASPIFFWWHKGDRKHVEAHHDIAPKYEWQGSSKASE